MNIIERYEIFKKGLVPRGTSVVLQKFFKTNPTVDQLLYLSEIERNNNGLYIATLLLYMAIGIMIGAIGTLYLWLVSV